jgi:hypothetical protein
MGLSMVKLTCHVIERGMATDKKRRGTVLPQDLADALESARGTRTHIKIDRAVQARFRAYALAKNVPMMQLFDAMLENEIGEWERTTKVPLDQDRDVVRPLLK